MDLLILALGFAGPDTRHRIDQLGVELDARCDIKTDSRHATHVPGLYCAGDGHRGQSLIVWAIAEGREAARAIDAYLRDGAAPWLPTRGADCHFGGR